MTSYKNSKILNDNLKYRLGRVGGIYSESERSSASNTVISRYKFGFGCIDHLSFGFLGDATPINVLSENSSSVEYLSVFWIISTTDCEFGVFFCFLRWPLFLLTDDLSDTEVSLFSIVRFSLRKMGVSFLVDGVDCDTDVPAAPGWVGGAAIGIVRLKRSFWVFQNWPIFERVIMFWVSFSDSPF